MTWEADTIEESLPDLSEDVRVELAGLAELRVDFLAAVDARADFAFDGDDFDFKLTFFAELVLRADVPRVLRALLLFFLMFPPTWIVY